MLGPLLGGVLISADLFGSGWRLVFLINIPVGLIALMATYFLVHDPEYLRQERAKRRGQPLNFDYIGLGLLVLVMSSFTVDCACGTAARTVARIQVFIVRVCPESKCAHG